MLLNSSKSFLPIWHSISSIPSEKSTSLADFLHTQIIGLHLEEKTTFLVNYLIDSLDENGFLPIEPILIADRLGYEESFVKFFTFLEEFLTYA